MNMLEVINTINNYQLQGYHIITNKDGWMLAAHFDGEFVDLAQADLETGTKQTLDNIRLSELAQIVAKGLGA
jgi:hypothetical protein